jgi:hypothetical protein
MNRQDAKDAKRRNEERGERRDAEHDAETTREERGRD